MFNNKKILITGGTGSFGKSFVERLIKKYKNISKLIIFSRDEFKQYEMQQIYSPKRFKFLRYFIGDVRDKDRLDFAFKDVDYVIHAAALKQVNTAEYNPFEFIHTNIIGAKNVIESAINRDVKKVLALSTDKACSPINLYGATKLCSDKLFCSANNIVGKSIRTKFSVVRYGNVFASRGSIIPLFIKQNKEKRDFTLTDQNMTRFNIFMNNAIDTVEWSLLNMKGSEIIVPKLKSFRIIDLIKAINKKPKIKLIGIRAGEKIHEELISESDSRLTIDIGNYYIILPEKKFFTKYKYKKLPKQFVYRSDINKEKLNVSQIKKILKENNVL